MFLRPPLRRTLGAASLLAGASAAALGGQWIAGETGLSALDAELRPLRADAGPSGEVLLPGGERRLFRDVSLETADAGTARFTVSAPAGPDSGPLPLVVVLAGFRTGREALRLVPVHGDAVVVAYGYPYTAERWERNPKWSQAAAVRSAALRVPAQVAALKAWAGRADRIDGARSALLGFSFGAVFAPAAQRLAAERGDPFRAVGLAYGGAGLHRMVRRALDLEPSWLEAAAARAIAAALSPLEPALHLPNLPGSFMLVHGRRDRRVPEASANLMTRLTPRPRDVVRVDTGHLHPSKSSLLSRLGDRFRAWLAEEGILSREDGGSASPRERWEPAGKLSP